MASTTSVCANCKSGWSVPIFVKRQTTPDEFEQLLSSNCSNHQLSDGGRDAQGMTCLSHAASWGNVPLIEHIVKIGGKELIDIGSKWGITPLHTAVLADEYEAAEALIRLGANVNTKTSDNAILRWQCFYPKREHQPRNESPLWSAIHRTNSISMIILLVRNGAQMEGCQDSWVSPKMRERFEQAQMEMEDQTSQINSGLPSFPEEVANLVDEYASALRGKFQYPRQNHEPPYISSDEEDSPQPKYL